LDNPSVIKTIAARFSQMKHQVSDLQSSAGETHADSSQSQRVTKLTKKEEKLFCKLQTEFEDASGLSLEDRILRG